MMQAKKPKKQINKNSRTNNGGDLLDLDAETSPNQIIEQPTEEIKGESQLDNIFSSFMDPSSKAQTANGTNQDGNQEQSNVDKAIANAQTSEADYIANTVSQFGLNINNLLMGGASNEDNKADDEDGKHDPDKATKMFKEMGQNNSSKLESLLGAIPDFAFLSETSVSMGQLFV